MMQPAGDSAPPQSCDVPLHMVLHAPSQMQLFAAPKSIVEAPGHTLVVFGSLMACAQRMHAPPAPAVALEEEAPPVPVELIVAALDDGSPPAPVVEVADPPGSTTEPPQPAAMKPMRSTACCMRHRTATRSRIRKGRVPGLARLLP
jgi:hypothetical protein